MNWATMTFSEKWLYVARDLKPAYRIQFLEAVFNYGMFGKRPSPDLPEDVLKAFEKSEYEIDLANKYNKMRQYNEGYCQFSFNNEFTIPKQEKGGDYGNN